jgi:geranylgeranyl diphosphate synthase, type I
VRVRVSLSAHKKYRVWSGRPDSNWRPHAPKACILSQLNYVPLVRIMPKNFSQHKQRIDLFLATYLAQKKNKLEEVNPWGKDAITRLADIISDGKTIRGTLVLFASTATGGTIDDETLKCASAMELFHLGFLIHDDIMDQDEKRRGKVTIHTQYATFAEEKGAQEVSHFGTSMGINVGDLCFFLGQQLLGEVKSSQLPAILSHVNDELANVVIAQMQDVSETHISRKLTQEEILSVYRHKTARYTLSLPLTVGALLTNADIQTISTLQAYGEATGILFQITDDTLSTGDESTTGKSTGSDAKNHKQTLATVMPPAELETLQKQLSETAAKMIAKLPFGETEKNDLEALLAFCQNRNK